MFETQRILFVASVIALAGTASAQDINIDVGANVAFPIPAATYGAAAAQVGNWNAATAASGAAQALVDTGGVAVAATAQLAVVSANFDFNNAGTAGDDQNLMDDLQDVGGTGASATWTFANLIAGDYTVYTYAWAPDSATFISTVNGTVAVGGAWVPGFSAGVTHAVTTHNGIPAGGSIVITIATTSGFGSVNGFQLVHTPAAPAPTGYCFGDDSGTQCPCSTNPPTSGTVPPGMPGFGCPNSLFPNGAKLASTGVNSLAADTLSLNGSDMPNSSALYFQGNVKTNAGAGAVFGDGLRCTQTGVVRLKTVTNSGNVSSYPQGGDPSVSVKGLVTAPGLKYYQVWYRNSAVFCIAAQTFNLTNGLEVNWAP